MLYIFKMKIYELKWRSFHRKLEKENYKIIKERLNKSIALIPYLNIREKHYDVLMRNIFSYEMFRDIYVEIYYNSALKAYRYHKKKDRVKSSFTSFDEVFLKDVINFIDTNVTRRIRSVRNTFLKEVSKVIINAFSEGYDVATIAKKIEKIINDKSFYRWRALAIARTETTSAANYGSLRTYSESKFMYQKTWISAKDERTRRIPKNKFDHSVMNGVTVDLHEYFNIQGETIPFPAAPTTKKGTQTSAANVINCRCSLAFTPKKDANGRLIRRIL